LPLILNINHSAV